MLAATSAVNNIMEIDESNEVSPMLLNAIQKELKKLSDKQMVILQKQFQKFVLRRARPSHQVPPRMVKNQKIRKTTTKGPGCRGGSNGNVNTRNDSGH